MKTLVANEYQPTMNLRFIKRVSKMHPGNNVRKFILQQCWVSKNGSPKWIDVPRFDPEAGDENPRS
jgi:hypothetical protein